MICKKNMATVQITDIHGGRKRVVHLCQECAKGQGIPGMIKAHDALASFLQNLGVAAAKEGEEGANLSCPACGTTFAEFRMRGRLGCPKDYEAFAELLTPLLEKIHGAREHVGKVPAAFAGVRKRPPSEAMQRARKLSELRRRLEAAVAAEEYERAAKLRDEIGRIEERRDDT